MSQKPTHEDLAKKVQALEAELSKRNGSESNLQASNEELISIFDSIDEPVYVADPETYEILYANWALKAQFGKNIRGKECYRVFQNSEAPCDFCTNPLIFGENTGRTHIWEFQNKVDKRWYRCIDRAINWPDGRMVRYEMAIDIHERKQMEEALRESEELYRSLVESSQEVIAVVNSEGVFSFLNHRGTENLGGEPEDFIGKTMHDLFPKEIADRQLSSIRSVIGSGKGGTYEEKTHVRDEERWYHTVITPLKGNKRNPDSALVIALDITERKQAENTLREREKELESQAANLEEVNAALKVLLKRRDEDEKELQEKVLFNVRELIEPCLEKLKDGELNNRQKAYLDLLESNLNEIVSPFSRNLYLRYYNLTPSEMQIAALVRHGKTTKQIANLLNLSARTIDTHRLRIRTKLGIRNKKSNLRSFLLSLR
ncbi:MAG: PAS domain S-box protein [Desulfobacteraceae bacterium]|jgi:PAS domain S-box-containing protein